MTRTDVHRPSTLVTEDYAYVGCFDTQPPPPPPPVWGNALDAWRAGMEQWRRELDYWMAKVRTSSANRGLHECHHCGTRIRYAAIMHHVPTGEHLAVGETCLENRFERATEEFHRLRKAAELDRERVTRLEYLAKFVEDYPDLAWLTTNEVPEQVAWCDFVFDVADKVKRYGYATERQVEAVRNIVAKSQPKPKDDEPTWVPAPEGRVEVEAKVLGLRRQPGFGYYDPDIIKALVQVDVSQDEAYKVWLTVPSKIDEDVSKGDTLRLKVTLSPKDDDPAFAIGKRPHLIEHKPLEEE